MKISLRKSFRETSKPGPELKVQILLAHFSNSGSWVTPRSRVIGSYLVWPGDLRTVLGSPPSRCSITSVFRFSALTLLTPATSRPSILMRNLNFFNGSKRLGLFGNRAMRFSSYFDLSGHLLYLDDYKFGRFEGGKADDDVNNPLVDIILDGGFFIAFNEIGFP